MDLDNSSLRVALGSPGLQEPGPRWVELAVPLGARHLVFELLQPLSLHLGLARGKLQTTVLVDLGFLAVREADHILRQGLLTLVFLFPIPRPISLSVLLSGVLPLGLPGARPWPDRELLIRPWNLALARGLLFKGAVLPLPLLIPLLEAPL